MKKVVLIAIGLLVGIGIAVAAFVNWGSRPTLSMAYYDTLKSYDDKPKKGGDTLSALTFNVGYLSGMTNNRAVDRPRKMFDENLQSLVQLLSKYHPNLVGFQEIDIVADRSYYINQVDSVAQGVGYATGFTSVNWDKRYVPFPYGMPQHHFKNVISGQAILSDFELLGPGKFRLARPDNSFLVDKFYITRLVQYADAIAGGKYVRVMNVHLEAFDGKTRVEQAKIVKTYYESYCNRMPVILMGDFNSEPPGEGEGSEAMEILMSARHIRSAVDPEEYQASPAKYYTYSSEQPSRKIDFILYNENFITKVDAKVLTEAQSISDHLPVYMTFYIHNQNDALGPF